MYMFDSLAEVIVTVAVSLISKIDSNISSVSVIDRDLHVCCLAMLTAAQEFMIQKLT